MHWSGSLYVPPSFRRTGVAASLIQAAAQVAKDLGIRELFLYTRHKETQGLYSNLGWRLQETLQYRGRPAILMKRILAG